MLALGLGALAHANWHANYYSTDNEHWGELSVIQAAHAAEILIKARIAKEHPLLIFEQLPRPENTKKTRLSFEQLITSGRTYQYADLPARLWATTGIRLPNLEKYRAFGQLRNSIQHFAAPHRDVSQEAIEFIYGVIDPFINKCWGLFAVDFNEDHEPYVYLVAGLIRRSVPFLVSRGVIRDWKYTDQNWSADNPAYRKLIEKRVQKARKLHRADEE
jgi:hypothetical protein